MVFLSGSESVQVFFYCLFIYVMPLEIQLSSGEVEIQLSRGEVGIPLTPPHFCVCSNELRWEVIDCSFG